MGAVGDGDAGGLEADLDRMLGLVGDAGGATDDRARQRLCGLARAIVRWNTAINLVSRKDIGRLMAYHFCDSASVLPLLGKPGGCARAAASPTGERGALRMLDVGGSNGLPGMVIAAILPALDLTVCDSRQKRLGFLEEVCRLADHSRRQEQAADGGPAANAAAARAATPAVTAPAGPAGPAEPASAPVLPNAVFELARVDSPDFQARHRESFDVIVARAVTRLRLLARWCLPLLRPGGRLVAYKGSRGLEELDEAEAYLFEHGAGLAAVTASPWSELCNPLRTFVIVDKVRREAGAWQG